jgi:transcriptional regulator with XRE-family HTH domain
MALTKLKLKLLEIEITQREVSLQSGINESIISLICKGRFLPDQEQRKKIAKVLKLPEEDLFE